jgi:hypothetical protein
MNDNAAILGLLFGAAVGAAGALVVLKRREETSQPVQGLGDPEVHTRSAGTMKRLSMARERQRAHEIMKRNPLGVRYTAIGGTGTYAVRPVTRPKAQAYLMDTFAEALAVARQNASGFVPYVVIQVEALTDWRTCQDRRDVGCGTANAVAYVDEKGNVQKTTKVMMIPETMQMMNAEQVVSPALVPELGF